MPIGFDAGDGGYAPAGERAGASPEELGEAARAGAPVIAQVWTRWRTAEDERVCPECGPLDGQSWPESDGPSPPLHNNCRCSREFAFIEWSTER